MRVALFGGSFDPPHQGHLAIARAAADALALDAVLFAPVGLQPLKPGGASAGFEDRAAMTKLAIAAYTHFHLSLIDAPRIDRPRIRKEQDLQDGFEISQAPARPNYTIDTLEQLRAEQPAGTELFLLLGADSFLTLPLWHRAAEIPFAATLIIASRPGPYVLSNAALQAALPPSITLYSVEPIISSAQSNCRRMALTGASGNHADLYLLLNQHWDISATTIREAIEPSASIASSSPVLSPAVLDYIRVHGLYVQR